MAPPKHRPIRGFVAAKKGYPMIVSVPTPLSFGRRLALLADEHPDHEY
jgi:hypothetical protein